MILKNLFPIKPVYKFLFILLIWVVGFLIPWNSLLKINWLVLGVSLVFFSIPGFLTSVLLMQKKSNLVLHFLGGFLISVTYIEFFALFGRFFNLPFDYIQPCFITLGGILLFVFFKRESSIPSLRIGDFSWFSFFVFAACVIFSILLNFQSIFSGDDFSYLAELTNAQHSDSLDFNDQIFGTNQLQPVRFWLTMLPYTWAFLSEISSLHGLFLLGYYLEPFLIFFAVSVMYCLNKYFLVSDKKAAASLLFQIVFFMMLRDTLQVGSAFFSRLSEDKAFSAFIQFPVLMIYVDVLRRNFVFKNILLVLVLGWGMALTHPIILAFAVFIFLSYFLLNTFFMGDYKKFLFLTGVVIILILPVLPLRFIKVSTATNSYDLDSTLENDPSITRLRISVVEGTPFYGFSPERIQIRPNSANTNVFRNILSWMYLCSVLLSFFWSILNWKKSAVAPFVFATSLLILITIFPFTGWLVGKFVTARMLWRTPWLVPIGLFVFIIIDEFLVFVEKLNLPASKVNFSKTILGVFFVFSIAVGIYFSCNVYESRWKVFQSRHTYKNNIQDLVNLANLLELEVDPPSIFIAKDNLMNYLPGLSSKSDVVFFRTGRFTRSLLQHPIQAEEKKIILSAEADADLQKRIDVLQAHNIRYILTQSLSLKNYYSAYSDLFYVEQLGEYWLIELKMK